jgi:hypothetical protein
VLADVLPPAPVAVAV